MSGYRVLSEAIRISDGFHTLRLSSMLAGAFQDGRRLAPVQLNHHTPAAFMISAVKNQLHNSISVQIGNCRKVIGSRKWSIISISREPDCFSQHNILKFLTDDFSYQNERIVTHRRFVSNTRQLSEPLGVAISNNHYFLFSVSIQINLVRLRNFHIRFPNAFAL